MGGGSIGLQTGSWLKYVFVIYANSFLLPLRGERWRWKRLCYIVIMPEQNQQLHMDRLEGKGRKGRGRE